MDFILDELQKMSLRHPDFNEFNNSIVIAHNSSWIITDGKEILTNITKPLN